MIKYKSKYNPSVRRKKHPFKVISQYANSNYKLVKFRMKQLVIDSDAITPLQLWKIAKQQKCICAISGIKLTAENISIDHIVPVSQGGSNNISNIRLVHAKVNKMRNDYTMEEFLDLCKKIHLNNIGA
jgi:5-methylcytosine-specific restriction endonuclease McrA